MDEAFHLLLSGDLELHEGVHILLLSEIQNWRWSPLREDCICIVGVLKGVLGDAL